MPHGDGAGIPVACAAGVRCEWVVYPAGARPAPEVVVHEKAVGADRKGTNWREPLTSKGRLGRLGESVGHVTRHGERRHAARRRNQRTCSRPCTRRRRLLRHECKAPATQHLADCPGQSHGTGGRGVSTAVPTLWRRHQRGRSGINGQCSGSAQADSAAGAGQWKLFRDPCDEIRPRDVGGVVGGTGVDCGVVGACPS